jgi:hypothetical protein
MPNHKISPDVLHAARPSAPTVGTRRRASLRARLVARVRAGQYDRLLAVGVVPAPESALSAHRARLTSTTERHAIAHSLRRAVRDARDGAPLSSRIPLNIPNITAAEDLIERAALRLHAPQPVNALGVARLRLILGDGAGPLYRFGRGDLPGRLGAALAEL